MLAWLFDIWRAWTEAVWLPTLGHGAAVEHRVIALDIEIEGRALDAESARRLAPIAIAAHERGATAERGDSV